LVTPSPVLLIGKIPELTIPEETIATQISLALDGISDPGNLGTIIRIADWFAIETIFCSEDCADAYNPKTVQASMGSLARVKVMEVNLKTLFAQYANAPVYGTFPVGENIFEMNPLRSGFLLIGSEAHGIRNDLLPLIEKKITIPRIGKAESLNAAVAAGIVCAWLKK